MTTITSTATKLCVPDAKLRGGFRKNGVAWGEGGGGVQGENMDRSGSCRNAVGFKVKGVGYNQPPYPHRKQPYYANSHPVCVGAKPKMQLVPFLGQHAKPYILSPKTQASKKNKNSSLILSVGLRTLRSEKPRPTVTRGISMGQA